jgi:energy-coupling factor transporter ATP-binding protein EcfA2
MLEMIREVFAKNRFFNGQDAPLKAHLTEGDPASTVLLIAGSNASGKSFGVKVLAAWLDQESPKVEALQVSMKYRTMAGIHRCFMYGPQGDEIGSTGSVSLIGVEGGLRTARGRDTPCWLMLDEPDTGLSEEFTPAMGEYLARAANEGLGSCCHALVVVSHSRALMQEMAATLAVRPHFVHVDEQPCTLADWLAAPRRRSVEELLALPETSIARYRALNKVLKD